MTSFLGGSLIGHLLLLGGPPMVRLWVA